MVLFTMIFEPGSLVFDIGAHFGESVHKFITVGKAGMVISVEPCLENFLKLRESIARDGFRAIPIHAAVLDVPRVTGLRRCSSQDGLTSTNVEEWAELYPDATWDAPQDIMATTLDSLIVRYGIPAYIKIDVEGAEFAAIMGLTMKPGALAFEFHGKRIEEAIKCLQRLRWLGFTKAGYVEADVDIENQPTNSIDSLIDALTNICPQWGNITVM